MRRFLARLVIRRSQIDYVEICKNQFIIAGSVELIEGRLEPVNGMELFRRPKDIGLNRRFFMPIFTEDQ